MTQSFPNCIPRHSKLLQTVPFNGTVCLFVLYNVLQIANCHRKSILLLSSFFKVPTAMRKQKKTMKMLTKSIISMTNPMIMKSMFIFMNPMIMTMKTMIPPSSFFVPISQNGLVPANGLEAYEHKKDLWVVAFRNNATMQHHIALEAREHKTSGCNILRYTISNFRQPDCHNPPVKFCKYKLVSLSNVSKVYFSLNQHSQWPRSAQKESHRVFQLKKR